MALTLMTTSVALADPDGPRCADQFGTGWANHAEHIIETYLLADAVDVEWTPGDELGQLDPLKVVQNAGNAGSPGHRIVGPGASFCDPVNP